ncbi:anti-sigma factor domain-containing protein [Microbacterium sp. SLBN-146]|uniref:anti-sigma factor n=1 Tax=Microbacterium sp. SLBN-146 TaxID=2768457 RepID=UPI0011537F9E|nr:anti-sigma factor [Microbacterium sp. SLBN-146]TQJ31400.1 anti-sigma-K factor rskA [Microbacterium sp. SLBN-146]
MNIEEFAELAAGAALNALSDEDRQAFEAALAENPEWQGIVDMDAATAAVLADSVPAEAPPLALRGTLLSRIATLPQDTDAAVADAPAPIAMIPDAPERPAEPAQTTGDVGQGLFDARVADTGQNDAAGEPPLDTTAIQAVSRGRWTRGLFGLAASLVILVALGFGAVNLNEWVNRPAAVVALDEIENAPDAESATVELVDGSGSATAYWSPSLGKVVLVTDGLPTVASGETFEMWFVREDGTPVSAGTFEAAGPTTTTLLDGAVEAGDTIAVTVEQAGGSETGAPTTEPIVAIPTV